jgi:hypothetical protein
MSCFLHSIQPIFMIKNVSKTSKTNDIYIFVGPQPDNVKEKLEILSKEKKISKEVISFLKHTFGKDTFTTWIDFRTSKSNIHFIYHYIRLDDSIREIKKKIFIYCSKVNQNKPQYLYPKYQELWIKNKKNQSKIIGTYYYQTENEEKIITLPHLEDIPSNKKYEIDSRILSFYDRTLVNQNHQNIHIELRKNYSENYLLLYDYFEEEGIQQNIIYVSDIQDEFKYLVKHKLIIENPNNQRVNQRIIKGYLNKYWVDFDGFISMKDIKIQYELYKESLERDLLIYDTIQDNIIDTNYFDTCAIKTVKMIVNNKSKYIRFDEDEEVDEDLDEDKLLYSSTYEHKDFVDLYLIFDYIRDKKINV